MSTWQSENNSTRATAISLASITLTSIAIALATFFAMLCYYVFRDFGASGDLVEILMNFETIEANIHTVTQLFLNNLAGSIKVACTIIIVSIILNLVRGSRR